MGEGVGEQENENHVNNFVKKNLDDCVDFNGFLVDSQEVVDFESLLSKD